MLPVYPLRKLLQAAPLLLMGLSGFTFIKAPAPSKLTGTWSVTEMTYGGQTSKPGNPVIKVYGPKQYSSYRLTPADTVPMMRGNYTLTDGQYIETITWAQEGMTAMVGTSNTFTLQFLDDQKFVIKGNVALQPSTEENHNYIVETWEKVK